MLHAVGDHRLSVQDPDGLNPLQLVLVGTVLELAVLILPLLFGGVRLVHGRPVLWMLLVIAAFSGMSSEGFDRCGRLDTLNVAGVLAFALAGNFAFALATFWLASLVRRLGEPLYLTWLNQGLDPQVRATVISMGSQANALRQIRDRRGGHTSGHPDCGRALRQGGVEPTLE